MTEDELKRDLDGKYLVYNYGEQDYSHESWELILYRVEWPNIKQVFSTSPWGEVGLEGNEAFFKYLKKQGIREVIAPHHLEDLLGISAQWFSMEDGNPKEIELWGEYEQICTETDAYRELIENGISVRFYDVEGQEFI